MRRVGRIAGSTWSAPSTSSSRSRTVSSATSASGWRTVVSGGCVDAATDEPSNPPAPRSRAPGVPRRERGQRRPQYGTEATRPRPLGRRWSNSAMALSPLALVHLRADEPLRPLRPSTSAKPSSRLDASRRPRIGPSAPRRHLTTVRRRWLGVSRAGGLRGPQEFGTSSTPPTHPAMSPLSRPVSRPLNSVAAYASPSNGPSSTGPSAAESGSRPWLPRTGAGSSGTTDIV